MPIIEQLEPPQLILSGDFDLATAEELRQCGQKALHILGAGEQLRIDMTDVSFVDSSGLGALVAIRKAAAESGQSVYLANVPGSIVRLLELTGLSSSFTISGSE